MRLPNRAAAIIEPQIFGREGDLVKRAVHEPGLVDDDVGLPNRSSQTSDPAGRVERVEQSADRPITDLPPTAPGRWPRSPSCARKPGPSAGCADGIEHKLAEVSALLSRMPARITACPPRRTGRTTRSAAKFDAKGAFGRYHVLRAVDAGGHGELVGRARRGGGRRLVRAGRDRGRRPYPGGVLKTGTAAGSLSSLGPPPFQPPGTALAAPAHRHLGRRQPHPAHPAKSLPRAVTVHGAVRPGGGSTARTTVGR